MWAGPLRQRVGSGPWGWAVVSLRLGIRYDESRVNISWRVLGLTPTHDQRETELNRQKPWDKSHEGLSLGRNCCNTGVAVITREGQDNVSNFFLLTLLSLFLRQDLGCDGDPRSLTMAFVPWPVCCGHVLLRHRYSSMGARQERVDASLSWPW